MNKKKLNIDTKAIEVFGDERFRFDRAQILEKDTKQLLALLFSIFPLTNLPLKSTFLTNLPFLKVVII
jgi:hypothetical protein